jgi:hypothetical protein
MTEDEREARIKVLEQQTWLDKGFNPSVPIFLTDDLGAPLHYTIEEVRDLRRIFGIERILFLPDNEKADE